MRQIHSLQLLQGQNTPQVSLRIHLRSQDQVPSALPDLAQSSHLVPCTPWDSLM